MVLYTTLKLVNNTKFDIDHIKVSETNRDDYLEPHRPESFNEVKLTAEGGVDEKALTLSTKKPYHIRFFLSYSDNSYDDFEFNHAWVLDMNYNLKLDKNRADHELTFARTKQSTNDHKKNVYALIITVDHTQRQLKDMEASKIHEQGLQLLQHDYDEEALVVIEKARDAAQSESLRREIRSSLATTHKTLGRKYFNKSFEDENTFETYAEVLQNSLQHYENSLNYAKDAKDEEEEKIAESIAMIRARMMIDEEQYEASKLMEDIEDVVTLAEVSRSEYDLTMALELCEVILNKYQGVKETLELYVKIEDRLNGELKMVGEKISNLEEYVGRLKHAQEDIKED